MSRWSSTFVHVMYVILLKFIHFEHQNINFACMLMLEPVVFASLSWFMYNLPKANENLFRYVSLGALRTPKVINCS